MIKLTALIAFVLIIVLYVVVMRMSLILDDIIEGRDIENEMDRLRDEFAKIREENKDDEIDRYVREILGRFDEKEEGKENKEKQ